ncbi:MAG: class II aldolase/adducin family protein [Eubacterium sp.]|nr:class II aldolase/adducin family protein [Eubacterium sp.]
MNKKMMHPADILVCYMERIYQYGMTTTSGGNLSVLDENGDMWITPGGTDKGSMTREDIVCVKKDGTVIGKHKPSSEYPFHQKIYQANRKLKAVLHAHSPALIAFSVVRKLPDTTLFPALYHTCGKVTSAKYAMTGSDELGEIIAAEFEKGCDITILENHGLVAAGESMEEAFLKFEALEFGAQIEMNTLSIRQKRAGTFPAGELSGIAQKDRRQMIEENIPASVCGEEKEIVFSEEEKKAGQELCRFIRRAYRQKLICGAWGSFSVRLDNNKFVMTAKKADRGMIQEEDLVCIDGESREQGKIPDAYWALHQEIYREHPEINAVIVAQPVCVMAFAVKGQALNTRLIPESYMILQDTVLYRTEEYFAKPEKAAKNMKETDTLFLLENDAVLSVGKSLLQAFDRLEVSEYTAKAVISAMEIGTPVQIPEEQIKSLRIIR